MSTQIFKCDKCDKSIELKTNDSGITTLQRCIITKNCSGNLHLTSNNKYNTKIKTNALAEYGHVKKIPVLVQYFTQETLASKWKIQNRTGVDVYVVVYDNTGNKINNSAYTYTVTSDEVNIVFQTPMNGTASIHNRGGVSVKKETMLNDTTSKAITNDSIITLAVPTLITTKNYIDTNGNTVLSALVPPVTPILNDILIEIRLDKPNTEPVFCIERFKFNTDRSIVWGDVDEVLIKSRRNYNLIFKDLTKLGAFMNTELKLEDVPLGSFITFLRISYTGNILDLETVRPENLLLLLTNPPYNRMDKDYNNLIDIGDISIDSGHIFLDKNRNWVCNIDDIENTYPPIRVLV